MESRVCVVVSDRHMERIVYSLLSRFGLPMGRVDIGLVGAPHAKVGVEEGVAYVRLVDSYEEPMGDYADRWVATERVFVAAPNVWAWLVGDEESAQELQSLAPHERGDALEALVRCVNVRRMAMRVPSLREFIVGVSELLGVPHGLDEYAGANFSRDVVAGLVREVPPDEVAWRTLDGQELTSGELAAQVEAGTELGRQYASDLLRVSRDYMRRRSRRDREGVRNENTRVEDVVQGV